MNFRDLNLSIYFLKKTNISETIYLSFDKSLMNGFVYFKINEKEIKIINVIKINSSNQEVNSVYNFFMQMKNDEELKKKFYVYLWNESDLKKVLKESLKEPIFKQGDDQD